MNLREQPPGTPEEPQSIPTTGLSPASPTALWAAELGLTPPSPGGVQRGPGADGAGGQGARPDTTSIELQGSVAVALGVRGEVEGELGREARLVVGGHSGGYR